MKTISGLVIAIGLCLVVLFGEASARGFGGFRGGSGGFGGGFDGGDRGRWFRAGEDYGARRAAIADSGFYSGGWGMDESDDSTNGDGGNDNDDQ
jgi:hypothetical protein